MTFADPLWLLLLPLVIVGPWIRRRKGFQFSDVSLIAVEQTLRRRAAFISPMLLSLSGVFLLLALARPHEEFREQIVTKEGVDIMLVVDTSGSMEVNDFRQQGVQLTRMEASKKVMEDFVAKRPNDRIGLVVFGKEAYTYVPLTLDHSGMIDFLRSIDVGLAGGMTAIGDGIAVAAKRLLHRESESKLMIVLTDGRSNAGIDPVEAGYSAAQFGIHIYTIGIGAIKNDLLGEMKQNSGVNENVLTSIAEQAEGKFYRATHTQELEEIYSKIDKLEPSTAEYTEYVHREEKAMIWILWSTLCLLAYLVLSESLLRRFP